MQFKNSNYLVILAGSPRGGEDTWNSLFKYVIEHLEADLAICTTDNFLLENRLFNEAKFKWIMKNPKNFEDYYSKHYQGNWKDYLLKGKGLGLYESGLIHFALKDFVYRNYSEELSDYDYIIYTRFDQYYVDYHPKFSGDKIYIPEGEDYFGICDRHVIFKSTHAKEYFSIIDYINMEETVLDIPAYPNCESVYKKHLEFTGLINKVERFKRKSFTSALLNEPTNWRVPSYKIFFSNNLMIKYPDEFMGALKNGINDNKGIKYYQDNFLLLLYYYYLSLRKLLGNLFRNKESKICEKHGHLFTSERYRNLKVCPECDVAN